MSDHDSSEGAWRPGEGPPASAPAARPLERGDSEAYQPDGYQPPAEGDAPRRSPRKVVPIEPERPTGSLILKLVLLALLGAACFGGYYAYCRYKVGDRVHALSRESLDLHQALMRLRKNIDGEDVRGVAIAFAKKAGVKWQRQRIEPYIEPMSPSNMNKLPPVAQMGMSLASKIPTSSAAKGSSSTGGLWVVGFKGQFFAKHGIYEKVFTAERYTWFKWVKGQQPGGDDEEDPD